MPYRIIAAMGRNAGIGYRGALPWRCSADMAHFARLTRGSGNNAVVMGRATWDSLRRRPLVGRDNIVISRDPASIAAMSPGVTAAGSFDAVKSLCDKAGYDDVWVIGGAQVYALALGDGACSSCHITMIPHDAQSDTYFPVSALARGWVRESVVDIHDGVECHLFVPRPHES